MRGYRDNSRYDSRRPVRGSSRTGNDRSSRRRPTRRTDSRRSGTRRYGLERHDSLTRGASGRQLSSSRRGREDRRAGGRRSSPRDRRGARSRRPISFAIPIHIVGILVLVAILTTYIATRITLAPQIDEAKKEAEVAKSQVSTLTQQLASVTGDQTYEGSVSDDKDDESGKDSKNSKKSTSSGGVESPWTSSGTYTSGDPVLDSEVKAFCDSHADKSMSQDTALLEIYKAIAWSDYVERDEAQHPSGKNWREQYARMYYEYGCTGNCYEFACFLAFCLQYMGLEDAKAEGVAVELKSGGLGDHGIVYVTNTDGVESICDTARGTDGWMLPAGTYNVQIQDFENAQPA